MASSAAATATTAAVVRVRACWLDFDGCINEELRWNGGEASPLLSPKVCGRDVPGSAERGESVDADDTDTGTAHGFVFDTRRGACTVTEHLEQQCQDAYVTTQGTCPRPHTVPHSELRFLGCGRWLSPCLGHGLACKAAC